MNVYKMTNPNPQAIYDDLKIFTTQSHLWWFIELYNPKPFKQKADLLRLMGLYLWENGEECEKNKAMHTIR